MFFRSKCEHKMKERYGTVVCEFCSQSQRSIVALDKHAAALDAAELKHGRFGAGYAIPQIMTGMQGGLAFFLLADKHGKWVAGQFQGACYQPIKDNRQRLKGANARYIIDWPFSPPNYSRNGDDWLKNLWKRNGGKTGWGCKWFTWMANESPWADCFITKDYLTAFQGGVVYDCAAPGEHVMAAMCGIRYIGETDYVPMTWVRATRHTRNPMVAFLAAHCGRAGSEDTMTTRAFDSGHGMYFQYYFDPKSMLKNALAGKLVKTGDPFFETWSWSNCVRMFGTSGKPLDPWGSRRVDSALKLPMTTEHYEKDDFGLPYKVGGALPTLEWMNEFKKELEKWQRQLSARKSRASSSSAGTTNTQPCS